MITGGICQWIELLLRARYISWPRVKQTVLKTKEIHSRETKSTAFREEINESTRPTVRRCATNRIWAFLLQKCFINPSLYYPLHPLPGKSKKYKPLFIDQDQRHGWAASSGAVRLPKVFRAGKLPTETPSPGTTEGGENKPPDDSNADTGSSANTTFRPVRRPLCR